MDGSEWQLKFRIDQKQRKQMILCTLFFIVLGVASSSLAYFNADGSFRHPIEMAILFAMFWGAWTLLGFYVLALYKKFQLCLSSKSLHQVGVFKKQFVTIALIKELRWRNLTGVGTIRILSPEGNMTIHLSNFTRSDRDEIIRFLRANVELRQQLNWETFRLGKLLNPVEVAKKEIESKKALKKYYKTYFYVFLFHVIAFGALGFSGFGPQFFYYAALNAGVCIWLHWKEKKMKQQEFSEGETENEFIRDDGNF